MRRLHIVIVVLLTVGCAGQPGPSGVPGPPNVAVSGTQPSGTQPSGTQPSGTASAAVPDVPEQLRFTASTVDGGAFDGASLAGRPAVLWFWAPWCPKCRAEAGDVARIAGENAGKVAFVGVAAQDQLPAMRDFVEQYGVAFTHVADLDAAVWRRFGVTYQPAYAFVDSAGRIEVVKDQLDADELASRVAALS